jgi:two-component system nitrogen regulation response regulator GlnG/two-component system response regulator HydG
MDDATATWAPADERVEDGSHHLALVLLAYESDPSRIGEVARCDTPRVLGRHGTLEWCRQRPGSRKPTGSLADRHLSRRHLELTPEGDQVQVDNLGRVPLKLNGRTVTACLARPGDLLQIADRVLMRVTHRPAELPGKPTSDHAFGAADAQGLLGESEAAWRLRERVAFLARREQHVLVLGESGTGKELVAQALHALSARGRRAMVARNAATIPHSLADAELFGNLPDYPNPGMPEREGLLGAAHGSTLLLDEFGELPLDLQARLLRVLDSGEYTRLGEAHARRADVRVVAATNRDPASLKHDVRARFPIVLQLPSLGERREDVPLLARHLLQQIAAGDPELADRFFDGEHPRLDIDFVRQLVTHPYTTHVRELQALLWQAITSSTGRRLALSRAAPPAAPTPTPAPMADAVDPLSLSPEVIQEALDRHHGRQDPVWRELGLSSRHVLARLVKKYDLRVRGRGQ